MTARGWVVVACGALAACGGAAPATTGTHASSAAGGAGAAAAAAAGAGPSALDQHRALAEFAGRYPTHEFQLVGNDCGSEFHNNVPFVVIDPDAQVLYTEGEQRHYDARVEDGELIADAWFGSDESSGDVCAASQFNERWRFHKRPDGGLTGFVEGLWPLPPNHCEHPCRVRFSIETSPSTGEAHAPPRRAAPRPEELED